MATERTGLRAGVTPLESTRLWHEAASVWPAKKGDGSSMPLSLWRLIHDLSKAESNVRVNAARVEHYRGVVERLIAQISAAIEARRADGGQA